MVEIALCLAVIAFALVAIIGVLPTGLRVQKDNREDTILNQEGLFLLEAIRSQSPALDYLTNYFESITVSNTVQTIVYAKPGYSGTLPAGAVLDPTLTNGLKIIRLLTGPKYSTSQGNPVTNTITAYVRSIGGAAAEKTKSARDFAFAYQLKSEVMPLSAIPPVPLTQSNVWRIAVNQIANFNDVTLTLQGPVLQRGKNLEATGIPRTFRAVVGGAWTNTGTSVEFKPNLFKQVQ